MERPGAVPLRPHLPPPGSGVQPGADPGRGIRKGLGRSMGRRTLRHREAGARRCLEGCRRPEPTKRPGNQTAAEDEQANGTISGTRIHQAVERAISRGETAETSTEGRFKFRLRLRTDGALENS